MNEEQRAKRRLFCYYYKITGNIEESAVKAGFPHELAAAEGLKTLGMKQYRELTDRLEGTENISDLVICGLKRLAFSNINDAVELIFSEETPCPRKIAQMNLFNVSEIKKDKGGGVEIKLFDRQKALEKLWDYSNSMKLRCEAESLINALKESDGENDN